MATTGQNLIRDALRIAGVQQSGEALSADQASDHLRTLNRMLYSWDIERLMVYTINPMVYNLVPGTQFYLLGPETPPPGFAQLDTVRPNKIEQAFIRVLSGPQPYDRPLEIVQDEGWAAIGVKNVASPIPTILYNQGDYPATTIALWPLPNAANQLVLYVWNQLTKLADVNGSLDFPPGYEDAVVYNLAARLAPEYGFSLDPYSYQMASSSKHILKALNTSPLYLGCDKAVLGNSRRGFNYLTGDFGRTGRE
jgi:hypothetical protein